jgi:hypothetical protein
MALFGSYAQPGVYTSVVIQGGGQPLFGNARIPVIIGEGQEVFTQNNVELHRGSSAVADDQVVNENISDLVTGLTRNFNTSYFPVVSGDGNGTITNDVTKISVTADNVPVTVVALNGTTGAFSTQDIIPSGANLVVTYFFKRSDTLIKAEDISAQVPAFATLTIPGASSSSLVISTTIPGAIGNNVTITLTQALSGSGVSDALAVSGAGTDAISIELRKTNNAIRTVVDLQNLVIAGIPTLDAGFLTVVSRTGTGAVSAAATTPLAGGVGPNTNTIFKVAHTPIVDGTNGGVVTTNPGNVLVLVNGTAATVTTVDGQHGLITLANPVAYGASLTVTYNTNTYQDTYDLLPASNVAAITQVGLGPNRSDYILGTDYVLDVDVNGNATINWGASTTTTSGVATSGFTPFGGTQITNTLVDEKVYLRQAVGVANGKNTVFTMADVPVDGSGLSRPTDDVTKILVYVGADPVAALTGGAVQVARLVGATGVVTLYNPPQAGQKVYVTSWRNALNDHKFTLTVVNPGIPGQGTYSIADELGRIAPSIVNGTNSVADPNFTTTGIVWPSSFSDLYDVPGAPNETITLTFQDDDAAPFITPPVQASKTIQGILFKATVPGTVGNAVTLTFTSVGSADATAITGAGTNNLTIDIQKANTTIRTGTEIAALFTTFPLTATTTGGGVILATGTNASQFAIASSQNLAGGTNGTTAAVFSNHFKVTSSRTAQQAATDGKGLSGGATTPAGANLTTTDTWTAETAFVLGSIIKDSNNKLQKVTTAGTSGATIPTFSQTLGVTTNDGGSLVWTNIGAANTPVGQDGYVGQTYVDASTGVKFTLVDPLQATNYGYVQNPTPTYKFSPGDTITFVVDSTVARVTGTTPTIAIGGLRTKVTTTFGSNAADTAIVNTFNKSGSEPLVGEFYFVSFTVAKSAADMAIKIFTNPADAYKEYGQPSVVNRLSLGIQLMSQNGTQTFGAIQVPKQTGLNIAADSAFIAAIQSLTTALPGSTRKANVIVPLSNSMTVIQFLSRQLITQANIRNKGEAIGFVGFSQYTTAAAARANARAIKNARVIAVGNPVAGIQITDTQTGVSVEQAVDGPFMAAAMAGLNCNPANDVATTLTNQNLVGFTRPLVRFDDATMNLMAADGLTLLTDNAGALGIRHYKSTDPSNPLTSEPTSTTIGDEVQQNFRDDLQQFIGRKLVDSLVTDIKAVCNARMRTLVDNLIISGYRNLVVTPDPTDPTTVNITVSVKPMFSLLYINITFAFTTTL